MPVAARPAFPRYQAPGGVGGAPGTQEGTWGDTDLIGTPSACRGRRAAETLRRNCVRRLPKTFPRKRPSLTGSGGIWPFTADARPRQAALMHRRQQFGRPLASFRHSAPSPEPTCLAFPSPDPPAASLGVRGKTGYGKDQRVSALQHFRAPEGLAPGPGYSHAVTG